MKTKEKSSIKTMAIAGAIGLGAWWLLKNKGGAAPPLPPPPGQGNLYGKVTDMSGAPIAGAAVLINGPALTATTDASGNYQVLGVEPGTYTVDFRKDLGYEPIYQPKSVSVTITASNNQLNVQMVLVAAQFGSLHGHVTNAAGAPVAGVVVAATQLGLGGGRQAISDAGGAYNFTDLVINSQTAGIYNVSFSKTGYYTTTEQTTLLEGAVVTVDAVIVLINVEPPPTTGVPLSVGNGMIQLLSVGNSDTPGAQVGNDMPFDIVGMRTVNVPLNYGPGNPTGMQTWPYGRLVRPVAYPASTVLRLKWQYGSLAVGSPVFFILVLMPTGTLGPLGYTLPIATQTFNVFGDKGVGEIYVSPFHYAPPPSGVYDAFCAVLMGNPLVQHYIWLLNAFRT